MRPNLTFSCLIAALLVLPGRLSAEAFTDPVPAPVTAKEPASDAPDGEPAPGTQRLGAALKEMGKKNPVLARVDGHEIRWTDVVASARDLPEEYRTKLEAVFPALLERLIDVRLIIAAGREAGLEKDEKVRRQVTEFEDRAISEAFIKQAVSDQATDAMFRARYDAYVARLNANAEVRARHILLDSEAVARDVIAVLNAGADFVKLARTRSLGPSAEQGGDLDYFTRDNMTPAFAEAAFSLEAGQYSQAPVQTEFGWHVIKVEDRRSEEPVSFFRMRDQLREGINRELMDKLLSDLRAKADIELFPEAAASE